MVIEGEDVDPSQEAIQESDIDNDIVEGCKKNEDELRLAQKVNSIDCIEANE